MSNEQQSEQDEPNILISRPTTVLTDGPFRVELQGWWKPIEQENEGCMERIYWMGSEAVAALYSHRSALFKVEFALRAIRGSAGDFSVTQGKETLFELPADQLIGESETVQQLYCAAIQGINRLHFHCGRGGAGAGNSSRLACVFHNLVLLSPRNGN